MADLSPMMKQYLEIKNNHPDTLVFFRLGDFYELFYEDAKIASQELDLVLTGRECGQDTRAPMCGVPFHSCESYLAKLVAKGYKVAICEQLENPAETKGLVRRDVVRVVTPGTVMETSMLDETRNNFIASLYVDQNRAGLCFADISTGELHTTCFAASEWDDIERQAQSELGRFSPKEVLVHPEAMEHAGLVRFIKEKLHASLEALEEQAYSYVEGETRVVEQFRQDLCDLGLEERPEIVCALGGLLWYLKKTQRTGMERMNQMDCYTAAQFMRIDWNTRRNLELLETMRNKEKKGSLLWVLDKTRTPMGKRLIRTWLERPLLSPAQINRRHDSVEEWVKQPMLCDEIYGQLSGIPDMERLMTRIVYGSANARDLRSLLAAVRALPMMKAVLGSSQAPLTRSLMEQIDLFADIVRRRFLLV